MSSKREVYGRQKVCMYKDQSTGITIQLLQRDQIICDDLALQAIHDVDLPVKPNCVYVVMAQQHKHTKCHSTGDHHN